MANFDPRQWPPPLNPLNDLIKICTGDYVGDIYHSAKFDPDRMRGFVSAHARLRAPNCLLGYFCVQEITYSQDAPTNLTQNTSKDAVPGKDVPFRGHRTKI